MTQIKPPLPKGSLRIILFIGLLALANLACFTINHTIVYDQDGSGAGVVLLKMTLPRDAGDQSISFEDAQEIKARLTEQGWEEVEVGALDDAHYLATARYRFGVEEGSQALSDVVPGFTLKIEEAENGYKYYTFEGNADYTELESFWNTVENDWAVNGIVITADFFGLSDSESKVELKAEEVQAMIRTYGLPAASLNVILPGQTPVEVNQFWDNEDAFMAGTSDMVTFSWKPGGRAVAPLKVQRRWEPLTTVTAAEAQAQIDQLLRLYEAAIPAGKDPWMRWATGSLAGQVNNYLTAAFNGGNYTCSDYQGRVLGWLDTIRTSPDENTRNLLKGLDYGPIETNGGGHRAVVLFQRGTNWQQTGLVLDPWPYQRPGSWAIGNWSVALWGYSAATIAPAPDRDAGKLYPHLSGKTSSYPASVVMQGDLSRGLAKPTRVLLVRSPVSLVVTLADGRRIGMLPDGTLVNDLGREADMYALAKDDGTGEVEWLLFLPETDFSVELSGTGTGDFHALLATPQGYFGFGPQPIQPGQKATFSAQAGGQLSSLTLPDGSTVQSQTFSPEQLNAALGIELAPAETAPDPAGGSQPATNDPIDVSAYLSNQSLLAGGLICLAAAGLLALAASVVIGVDWLRGRRR